jgi:hypothetical protein
MTTYSYGFAMSHPTTCSRCRRTVPDLPNDWEVIEDDHGQPHEVCPACVTSTEPQALDEDTMDSEATTIAARARQLRRRAEGVGLSLRKSRRRDPRDYLHGTYGLYDVSTNALVAGDSQGYGLQLDVVELILAEREG